MLLSKLTSKSEILKIIYKVMLNLTDLIAGHKGTMLLPVLGATTIFLVFISGLASWGVYQNKLYRQQYAKTEALHVAEAGINYYVWHLAHAQDDYYDGTGADPGPSGAPYGPYVHAYASPAGDITGSYSLEITPPPSGSTIVKIKSTGWLANYPNIKRIIEVRYGVPSLAHFSFLTNTDAWFGENESVVGELHSNGGIRMDGTNDSLVTSARSNYYCTGGHGCSQSNCSSPCAWIAGSGCQCPAVWGSGPNSALWDFPVPQINFINITTDIARLKNNATSSGVYLPASNKGYHIIFLANGTFDVYNVTQLKSAIRQYNDAWTGYINVAEEINKETFISNRTIPANGAIYIEDDVWVEGTVNGRATLVAATLPDQISKRKTIYINNNLNYLARDGSHILGLIAQKDVKVPRYAPTNLVIDATLLAQNGRVFRNLYSSRRVTNNIEIYGGIITNQVWTWTWVSGSTTVDGYDHTNSIYDPQVTFSPPPSFPNTGQYEFISWDEY